MFSGGTGTMYHTEIRNQECSTHIASINVQALLVLQAAQQSRTHSAPVRLAALALRGLLGAPPSAMECFDALAIKHIQHDTLSGELPCAC